MFFAVFAATLAFAPQQQLDTTFTVRSGSRLQLENRQGSIAIDSWERDEVRVRARTSGSTRVRMDRTGSTVQLEASGRRGPPGNTDWEITVPRRFDIEIDAFNSSIDVSNVEGDVKAETMNGSVTLTRIRGRINAESTQGRIIVRDSRGELQAETVNQGIEISGHEGEVHAETVNGGIQMGGIRSATVEAETVNGNVQYEGEIRDGGHYSLSTHNGGIVLYVPQTTNADVTVETFRGEIDSEFPVRIQGGMGNRRHLEFTVGNGGARIELASFGGSVRLRRPDGGRSR
jgi:DUF4097 and DUF4098 domain-containing protein YvlB